MYRFETETVLVPIILGMGAFLLSADSHYVGAESPGIAVVELFTSEGCSYCPPADLVLKELVDEREDGRPVYCLSYHVTDWDKLGWKDPFSQQKFSDRQREYARAFGIHSPYTPQMFVNGSAQFLGSDMKKASYHLAGAMSQPNYVEVSLHREGRTTSNIQVYYELQNATSSDILCFALVSPQEMVQVTAGENKGQQLVHYNVVVSLESIPVPDSQKGTTSLPLPPSYANRELGLIAFVQDPQTMRIKGARDLILKKG